MRFEIGLVKKLTLALALVAFAGDALAAKVDPFKFSGSSATQQEYWDYLMRFKMYGAEGIEFAGRNIKVPDSSGWFGTSKGDFTLKNGTHVVGGPILIGGSVAFSSGDGDEHFTSGPVRIDGDVSTDNWNAGSVINGVSCIRGNVSSKYNDEVAYANRFHGTRYTSCPDSIPNFLDGLSIPSVGSISATTLNAINADNRVVEIVVPEGEGMYDIRIPSIRLSNESSLFVKMPTGGRLTRIFVSDGLSISAQSIIQVQYKNENGDGYTTIANSDYAGNLLFYVMDDFTWDARENDRYLQGSFISTGTITIKQQLTLAGQLLARKLIIDANFDGTGFNFVPFDPNKLNIVGSTGGHFKESDTWMEVPIALDSAAKVDVSFKYCFQFAPSWYGGTDAASTADFNTDSKHKFPVCKMLDDAAGILDSINTPFATVKIAQGTEGPTADTRVWVNPKLDYIEEDASESFRLVVFDLVGAVSPSNTRRATYELFVDDAEVEPKSADGLINAVEDSVYTLTLSDVKYESKYNAQQGIVITSLPSRGSLSVGGKVLKSSDIPEGGLVVTLDTLRDDEDNITDIVFHDAIVYQGAKDGCNLAKSKFCVDADSYTSFKFKVIDVKDHMSKEEYTMTVGVAPRNDAPTVNNPTVTFQEGSTAGATGSTKITVKDVDDDTFTYAFDKSHANYKKVDSLYEINSTTGVISVKKGVTLDYETADSVLAIVVKVTDAAVTTSGVGKATAKSTVTLKIIDVNEPPVIPDDGKDHYDVNEHSKKDFEVTRILFTDEDNADAKVTDFVATLTDNKKVSGKVSAEDLFAVSIDKDSKGDFYIVVSVKDSAKLNYEDLAAAAKALVSYDVKITLKDQAGATGCNSVSIDRKLNVLDINEAPTTEDASFNPKENIASGSTIGTVKASDLDTKNPDYGTLYFTIRDEVPFTINNSGVIKVAEGATLNYEKQPVYEFDVEVTDKVAAPVISHVVIILENVNEDPKISCLENDKNCEGPFDIKENSATGTVIHNFAVNDDDDDSKFALDKVVLTDSKGTDAAKLFDVVFNDDKTQISITVKDKSLLDYEKVKESYTVKIKVSDAAGAADSITRIINVIDVNEAPTAKPFSKEIAENLPTGTVVGTVEASDPDIKNKTYSKLTYSIPVNEDASGANDVPFTINATTGEISVKDGSKLDYETNPSFTFKVEVKDIEYTATSTVTITLSDEEEPPEIIPDPECDEDKEDCCDPNLENCGEPDQPPDTTCVTNCGYIKGDTMYVSVRENSKTGTQILKYYVKDQDVGDLVSMKVYFEDVYKSGADSLFVVSPTLTKDTKGNYYFTLTVKDGSKLDFEKVNEKHVLRIITKDDGGKSDAIVRVINVIDLNEKPVVADISKDIKENLPNGTVVDTVKATDPDIKNKAFSTLSYSILGADTVPFVLDTKNPTLIKVKDRSKLNYEVNPKFTFYVQVTDGTLSDTATIVLKLTDEEEPPEIIPHDPECEEDDEECNKCDINFADCGKPIDPPDPTCTENCGYRGKNDTVYVNVRENTETGTPILSYYVKDEDAGDLASMEVFFKNTNASGADSLFSITPKLVKDAKGYKFTVSVKDGSKLDYEKITESHRIVITVKDDAGLTDTIIRVIKVVDVNEPLTVKNANFNVDENSANGTVVGKMSASDQDTKHPEIFAVLKYSIIEEDSPFKMDSNKVVVADGSMLNYEKDSLYTIHVRVTDGEFSDIALVKIKLNNTNEEPFIKCLEDDTNCDGPYDVEENTPTNTVIHTFAVMDDDKDPAFRLNSASISDMQGTNARDLFAIKFNKDSSQVTVYVKDGSKLDYEKVYASYTVKIKISDAMGVADSIVRVINVIDVNEEPSIADSTFTIAENTKNGTVLGALRASDPDIKNAVFSHLTYEVIDDVPFKMDSNKVVVAASEKLDFEKVTEFYFDVRVTDGGNLTDLATVYVKLTDEEEPPEIIIIPECDPAVEVCHVCDAMIEDCDDPDEPPPSCKENCGYLKNDTVYVNVRENSPTGTQVLEYYVKDQDVGDLETMKVHFVDNNKSGSDSLFSITPSLVKDDNGYKFVMTVTDGDKLDYEKTNHIHEVMIIVNDDGGKSDSIVRVIKVVDVNEPPYIVKDEFDLKEHNKVNAVVGTIEWGDDKDMDGVSNPAFRDNRVVAVDGATDIFDVDSMGVITVKKTLNYETDDTTYTLVVSVQDKNDPTLNSTENMIIHLKNVLETPVITSTEFSVDENPADRKVIGTLTSEDLDDLKNEETRTYTLIGTSEFVKVTENGEIVVINKDKFDYETVDSFTIKVKVTDPQGVSSDTTVTIKINDVNEAPNLDDKPITVSEHTAPGTVIDTLKATDPDKDPTKRELTYTIVDGDTSLFEIDSKTGVITLKDSLDYEKATEHILKVEVSDGEFADIAKITVIVENVVERSVVEIQLVDDGDTVYTRPDSVFTNRPDVTICWTEDGNNYCSDTTLTEGIHTIIKTFKDPKKDYPGADTVVIQLSTAAPQVIVSAKADDLSDGGIFTLDESLLAGDTNIYVNDSKNDIKVTIKDPVNKKDSTFTVKLDLETVNVSSSDLESVSNVLEQGKLTLNENPKIPASRTPVNGSEVRVDYTETVDGKTVTVTYYTDKDGEVLKTPVIVDGKVDSIEVITVSYKTQIGGREVTVSYQADAITGQVLNVASDGALTTDDKILVATTPTGKPSAKDTVATDTAEMSVGSFKVTYEYEDEKHNTVVVTYTVDEKGNIVKNAEGDIGYSVSYTYENKFGNAATQSVFIVLDQTPPVVKIVSPVMMEKIRANSVEVVWTVNGVVQDTLTLQGLKKGFQKIKREYRDKAGNVAADSITVQVKDAKSMELEVVEAVTEMSVEKVDEYYAANPPKKGETFAVSIENPTSGKEIEALTGGSYGQAEGSFDTPYPGVEGNGHLGPTVAMEIRLPVVNDVAGLATFDDLILSDGTISSRGVNSDRCKTADEYAAMGLDVDSLAMDTTVCVKFTQEQYAEKYCEDDIDITGDLSKINLYSTRMHAKVWIYTSLGGFVDYYNFKIDLNDPDYADKAGVLNMYFEQKPDKNGEIRTEDGRVMSTGAYLYKVEADIRAKLRCSLPPFEPKTSGATKSKGQVLKKSDELLQPFGYKRPVKR